MYSSNYHCYNNINNIVLFNFDNDINVDILVYNIIVTYKSKVFCFFLIIISFLIIILVIIIIILCVLEE